ncbi:MAG: DNA cytosine methyltransferase [Gemmatimonadaceae bacterium]|nr:DNA cytosine methyltransferase [Gemmatimonadaceae bacterium]
MKAISLFSGVGGFEQGFERAGIETVLQAEKDPWCLEVLARHWPQTERVSDVGCVSHAAVELQEQLRPGSRSRDVDLVYGGFPCQDISVAGGRAGLRGERSGLWFEFARVLEELRPRWCVIENVAGLLSSGSPPGADLGLILDTLVKLGYGVAWRTLDAQYAGVPQRRRRVFIVGGPGDGTCAAAVLAVGEGGGGHPAASGTPREELAYSLAASARGTGDGHGNAWNSTYIANPLGSHAEGGQRNDLDNDTYVVTSAVTASAGHHGHSSPRGDGSDNLVMTDVAYALAARNAKGVSLLDSQDNFVVNAGVRRLTPRECERLMGWPEDHTRWTVGGREIADSHRYRMVGNGVVAPVAEWIGHRLMRVEGLLTT